MKDKNRIEINATNCNGDCIPMEGDCPKCGQGKCQENCNCFTPNRKALEARIAELEAENAKCEFVPLVKSDFENDRNEVMRGIFIVRQFEFKGVFYYSILDGYGEGQFDTLEEVNAYIKRAWQELGGVK